MEDLTQRRKCPKEPYGQTKRLIGIIQYLHKNRRRGISRQIIMEKFKVGYRTACRDINALQEMYIPLVERMESNRLFYRLIDDYHLCK